MFVFYSRFYMQKAILLGEYILYVQVVKIAPD